MASNDRGTRSSPGSLIPAPHVRRRVRALLFAVVVLLPAQIAFAVAIEEPYPAFLFPPFKGTKAAESSTTVNQTQITVTMDDGEEVEVPVDALFGEAQVQHSFIMRTVFPPFQEPSAGGVRGDIERWTGQDSPLRWRSRRTDRAHDEQTVDWLKKRLTDVRPPAQPVSVNVAWERVSYDPDTLEVLSRESLSNYRIDLRG